MEKFLRLLNPKTINYEADRIDGGMQQLTAQDVLLAMSYAKLSPLQDNLIRLKYLGANTKPNVDAFTKILVNKYQFNDEELDTERHLAIVLVALTEFCLVPVCYKPSQRNRAVICGWSQSFVHKYLNRHINFVVADLNHELKIGEIKIFSQLSKIK